MSIADTQNLKPATEEAAKRGITRERLVRLIQSQQVPGVSLGGRWFVLVDEVETATTSAA